MIHPPTITSGRLHPHEIVDVADMLDDLDAWIRELPAGSVPDDLVLRVSWWAYRLANTGDQR
jgi:hypothetical protein